MGSEPGASASTPTRGESARCSPSCPMTTMLSPSSSSLLRQFIASPQGCARTSLRPARALSYCVPAAVARPLVASCPTPPSPSRPLALHRRTFASSSSRHAAVAQKPKVHRAEVLSHPSQSELQQEEDDDDEPEIDFVPPGEVAVDLTDRAAEVCLACTLAHSHLPPCSSIIRLPRLVLFPRTATTFHRPARGQPGRRVAHRGGEWRLPRVPIQDGAREETAARRLVRAVRPCDRASVCSPPLAHAATCPIPA